MKVLFLPSQAVPAPAELAAHAKERNQYPIPNAVFIPEGLVRAVDRVFELRFPFLCVCLPCRGYVEVRSQQ